ncbi:MAG: peptidoglycan DD-metalloendopeptidase family protein [Ilumatobacteraceae bacterium]
MNRVGRSITAVAVALITVFAGPASSNAIPGPDEQAAAEAAAAIAAAQARANEAAGDFFEAQSQLEQLVDEAARLANEQALLEGEVNALRTQVEAVAVNRFLASGSSGIPLLTDFRAPNEQLQTDALVAVATDSSADAMDTYDRLRSELDAMRETVAANQRELDEQRQASQSLQRRAEDEVGRLERIEEQRLDDERVHLAFLATQAQEERIAEERRQRAAAAAEAEAKAKADAEATAKAQADAAAAAVARADEERRTADEQASVAAATAAPAAATAAAQPAVTTAAPAEGASGDAAAAASAPAAPEPAASDDGGDQDTTTTGAPAVDEPATTDDDSDDSDDGASGGGDSGGRGDSGGGGGLTCPVAGSASYADGWGNPRSVGRRHQGVDMMASTGTPLVAVVSGSVELKHNSLGGNAIWLEGSNGDSYYYAHLSAFEGSGGSVSQGQTIGYVGDTGNASGVPHLHFEVHPGGGSAVNPFPYVVAAGC